MDAIHQEFTMTYRYAVHFTRHAFQPQNEVLREVLSGSEGRARVHFVIDDGVAAHHPHLVEAIEQYARAHPELELAAAPQIVPGGEAIKNSAHQVERLQQSIERLRLCRHSYLAAIGGGAVLDAAGYAAATAHRGIRLLRFPTTVLAQNDAGLGVKNGINAFGKKNFLGTFAPPYAVINDFAFLDTLTNRDWRSGIAEAVKVALIRDANFFAELERNSDRLLRRDGHAMQRLVERCAELHLAHIRSSGDPFEMGSARPLDFGHWAAHKLEQLTSNRLRHGEAVAIGIALDSTYSALMGFLAPSDRQRVLTLLAKLGLLWGLGDAGLADDALLHGVEEFRQHLGGELTITMLRGIGRGFEVHEIDGGMMRRSIRTLLEAHEAEPRGAACVERVPAA